MSSCETVDLVAYLEEALEGDALGRVEEHLAGCEACRKSLEELTETADWLVELFSASGESCPPAEALAEFVSGEGDASTRETLKRHVERCGSCGELMEVLRSFEAQWVEPDEGPELPEAIKSALPSLAEGALAERLRRAAEAALGAEAQPGGREMAEWLKRVLEPGTWPQAALPTDAAEVDEEEGDEPEA